MSQNDYLSTNIWKDETWQIESDKTKEKLKSKVMILQLRISKLQMRTDRTLQIRFLMSQGL